MGASLRFKEAVIAALNCLDDEALNHLAFTLEATVEYQSCCLPEEPEQEEPAPVGEVSVAGGSCDFPSEPPAASVREAFDRLVHSELAMFADNLETARLVYKDFPRLVTAKKWPARLRAAYIAERNEEPESNINIGSPVIAREERAEFKKKAVEIARCWMQRERGFSEVDVKLMKEMGVAL
jgi:hypothetical protein